MDRLVTRAPDSSADDNSLSASRVRRAAIALFAEKGFAGTSIREIASHSGLSIATLYHYIPTKQALLYDLMLPAMAACWLWRDDGNGEHPNWERR